MSPEPQKTKTTKIKKQSPNTCIIINQPIVRNFSTGGGHGPERHADRRRREARDQEVAGLSSATSCKLIGKPHRGDAGSDAAAAHGQGHVRYSRCVPEHAVLQDAGQPASSREA